MGEQNTFDSPDNNTWLQVLHEGVLAITKAPVFEAR